MTDPATTTSDPAHRPPCRYSSGQAAGAGHARRAVDHARAARRGEACRGALRGLERRRGAGQRLDLSVRRAVSRTRRLPRRHRAQGALGRPAVLRRHRQRLRRARSAIRRLMRIDPANRVIEVGNIMYTPAMQRTARRDRSAISVRAIRLRRPRLSPLRVEVQQPQRALEARGRALRLHVRGRFPSAHDRQGPQSRHSVVCDARRRMAGAQGRLRALAFARQFRRRRAPESQSFRTHAEGPHQ